MPLSKLVFEASVDLDPLQSKISPSLVRFTVGGKNNGVTENSSEFSFQCLNTFLQRRRYKAQFSSITYERYCLYKFHQDIFTTIFIFPWISP